MRRRGADADATVTGIELDVAEKTRNRNAKRAPASVFANDVVRPAGRDHNGARASTLQLGEIGRAHDVRKWGRKKMFGFELRLTSPR